MLGIHSKDFNFHKSVLRNLKKIINILILVIEKKNNMQRFVLLKLL